MQYYIGGVAYGRNYLSHHGVQGTKWGVRRFQNEDGSLTADGKQRYGVGGSQPRSSVGRQKAGEYSKKSNQVTQKPNKDATKNERIRSIGKKALIAALVVGGGVAVAAALSNPQVQAVFKPFVNSLVSKYGAKVHEILGYTIKQLDSPLTGGPIRKDHLWTDAAAATRFMKFAVP